MAWFLVDAGLEVAELLGVDVLGEAGGFLSEQAANVIGAQNVARITEIVDTAVGLQERQLGSLLLKQGLKSGAKQALYDAADSNSRIKQILNDDGRSWSIPRRLPDISPGLGAPSMAHDYNTNRKRKSPEDAGTHDRRTISLADDEVDYIKYVGTHMPVAKLHHTEGSLRTMYQDVEDASREFAGIYKNAASHTALPPVLAEQKPDDMVYPGARYLKDGSLVPYYHTLGSNGPGNNSWGSFNPGVALPNWGNVSKALVS